MNNISVVLNGPITSQLESELFPANGFESGAILLLGINDYSVGPRGIERRFLAHRVTLIPDADIESASP